MKIAAVILSLTAYLLCLPGLGSAGIICFGDDGHVLIESTANPISPIRNAAVNGHNFENEEDDHCKGQCSSCFDLPLSFTAAHQTSSHHKYLFKLERNPLCRAHTGFPGNTAARSGALLSSQPPLTAANAATRSLRTVILLI